MSYRLGIDLGTTWTAAATWRDDRAAIVSLGQRRAAIPSVVLLREDGEFLTGDSAVRRALTEPERVAREFKRRIGDTTPIIVGGTPQSAENLTSHLLRSVVDAVSSLEGTAPRELVIAHPANWGSYKIDLLNRIITGAGHDPAGCLFITEPEAAAITYATEQRVGPGQNVCVYDLGGGTFDTTVLQRTATGFRILGRPQGIERLGGVDFDAAIYAYVTERLGSDYQELDPEDGATLTAIARLRLDCIEAKEALSADTDATIPILLPGLQTEVRLTRAEFERLIRPTLHDTIETTRRTIASADLEPGDIDRVLLVGGSSRIPLISQLVQNELDVNTSIDSHPKHAIAIGAAIYHLSTDLGPGGGPTVVAIDVPLVDSPVIEHEPPRPAKAVPVDASRTMMAPPPSAGAPGPGNPPAPAQPATGTPSRASAHEQPPAPPPSQAPAPPGPAQSPPPQSVPVQAPPRPATAPPPQARPGPAPPGPAPAPPAQVPPGPAPAPPPQAPPAQAPPRAAQVPPPPQAPPGQAPSGPAPAPPPQAPPAKAPPGPAPPGPAPASPGPAPAPPGQAPPGPAPAPPPRGIPAQAPPGPAPAPPPQVPPGARREEPNRPPDPPGARPQAPARGPTRAPGSEPPQRLPAPRPAEPARNPLRPSDTAVSPVQGPGPPRPRRPLVPLLVMILLIALMIGFGAYLLLRPPSQVSDNSQAPPAAMGGTRTVQSTRTHVRLSYEWETGSLA